MAPVQSKLEPNVAPSGQDSSAIVGLACRVPGASSPSKLWDLLESQKDVQQKMPADRFNVDAFYHPDGTNKSTTNARYGYFLDQDLKNFDAGFFNISGKEAESMDPQQRLLLEVVYEALEDAGITLEEISGSTASVFCGCFTNDYATMLAKDLGWYPKYTVTGTGNSILSNRISYFFNLHGASATIDTACSSSLVCFHMGNQTLRTYESDISIIVGSALHYDTDVYVTMTDLGMLSTDGRCRAFDTAGRGYVRGEGICAAVIKRAADAKTDGNTIRALVRGTHVNHDGIKQGITMPNPQAHEALIRRAYKDAGLDPKDTQYFEAHGTGTPAGDPRETRAIGAVFAANRTQPLVVGSIKTNIGHLEGASGLAAVIKATMMLERGKIPANLHFNNPNPSILFDDWKIKVPTKMQDWPTNTGPKRASVNSFGYGGSNGHVILEAYEPSESDVKSDVGSDWSLIEGNNARPILSPLTSHSKKAGTLLVNNFVAYLQDEPNVNVHDFAHTLSTKRTMHKYRSFAIGKDVTETVEDMMNPKPVAAWAPVMETEGKPRIGFVFTGQGGQWYAMGRQLIEQSAFFRQTLERCDAVLQALPDRPDWSVIDELLRTKETSRLGDTRFSQPICTALQLALVDLLAQWGIESSASVGHSSGEMGAAYAAGIFSFENTIVTAYYRGVYMSNASDDAMTTPGAMMAVGMTEPEAVAELKAFEGRLSIAAINGPSSITLSGDKDAILELKDILVARKVFARELQVTQAFHSHHMYPLAPGYKRALEKHENFIARPAMRRMVSSVTARVADSENMGPDYWTANMVGTVKFSDALTGILLDDMDEKNVDMLLEVGPHPALKGPARQVMSSLKLEVPYFATLTRGVPDYVSLVTAAGQLFAAGYPVDLAAVNSDLSISADGTVQKSYMGNRLKTLPTYAWDHTKYWAETRMIKQHRLRESRHILLGARVPGGADSHPSFRNFLRKTEIPWLVDHQVEGKVIFPAAGYITIAIEALVRLEPDVGAIKQILIRDTAIKSALALTDKELGSEIILELRPLPVSAKGTSNTWYEFVLFSYDDNERCVENCRGQIALEKGSPAPVERTEPCPTYQELQKGTNRSIPVQKYYEHLWSLGLHYGHSFKLLAGEVETGPGFAIAPLNFVNKDHRAEAAETCVLHPTLLDASFHTLFGAIEASLGKTLEGTFVPTFCRSMKVSGSFASGQTDIAEQNFYVVSNAGLPSSRVALADLRVHSKSSNQLLIDMEGLECTALGDSSTTTGFGRSLFFRIRWQPAFDFLGDSSNFITTGGISEVVDDFAHQHPDSKILLLSSKPDKARDVLKYLGGSNQERRRFGKLNIYSFTDFKPKKYEAIDEAWPGLIELGGPVPDEYDLIIVAEEITADISPLLKSEGYIIRDNVKFEAKHMAPVFETPKISAWRTPVESVSPEGPLGLVLASNASKSTHAVASQIEKKFPGEVYRTSFEQVAKGQGSLSTNLVVLASLDEDVFFDTTSEDNSTFEVVKKMLTEGKRNIVWALQGATMESSKPEQALITGLARSARSENEHLRFVTFDIEETFDTEHLSQRLLQFLDAQIFEDEITERAGTIYVPRLESDDSLNSKLRNGVGHAARLEPFDQPRSLALEIQKVGLMDTLAYTKDQELLEHNLAADEIEIEVHASAIGSRDIAVCTGNIVASALGDECSGVVIRKGSEVGDDAFKLGDRVMAWKPGHGAHRKIVRNPASLCQRLGDMSFEVAAALPLALTTACYALREVARLQQGESVLIHSAGNGVGQIAVQLAQHVGANIIVSAGSTNERRFLRDSLSLREDQIVSNRDQSFVQAVMKLTQNKGVDVVMNNLTGELLHATWSCVAPFGRFVEVGTRDINDNTKIDMGPFQKSVTFASVNMVRMYECQRPLAARLLKECCNLLRDGVIKPLQPILAFPYSEASEAFSVAQTSESPNKVVLQRMSEDMVPVLPSTFQNNLLFDPKKIYLLVGGLGGLGRTLAEWMVRRGAKRLAFLSRSGASRPEASSTLEWLKARDVQTSVYCGDIAGYATVRSCIESIGSDLAGIFQAAMVLQDAPFEKMSYKLWLNSLRPKVAGAYNLHKATLKSKLDFFICFSSCSAMVGAKAQANYSAANCFLDALMRNRREMDLPGTTMNVGMIVGIGAVSENSNLQAVMERIGYDPVNEEELLYQIEEAVTTEPKSCTNARGVDMHQNITGISLARKDLYWAEKPLFQNLYRNHDFNGSSETSGGNRDLYASLRAASYPVETTAILTAAFVDKVSAVSGVEVDQIQPSNPLSAYGLDSLVAVELRKWFSKAVGVDVPMFDILGSKTMIVLLNKAIVTLGANFENEAKVDAGAAAAEAVAVRTDDVQAHQNNLLDEVAGMTKPANLPMSSFQTRMWFSHNFVSDKSFLNLPITSRITGKPVLAHFRQALQEMKNRNEILRTAYYEGEDYPEQIILDHSTAELAIEDFSSQADPTAALEAHISVLKKEELNIEEGEVMRTTLVKLAETEHVFVMIFHHIAIDGGSAKAFLDQFVPIYNAIANEQELQSVVSPALSYSDFAVWHNTRLRSAAMKPHIRFWKQKFKGAPSAGPLLPFAKAERPPQNDYKRAIHRATLPLPILNRMKRICSASGTTPFQFLLAAFRSFHYRYTEEKDLTILMIDGNRPHPDLGDMLGFFVNMIPIRCSNDCDTSFDHLLTAVKDDVLEAMAHSEVSFDTIVDVIGNEKDSSCFPLGQVVINYQTLGKVPKYSTKDFEVHNITTEDMPTACELNLEALEDDKGLAFRLEYSSTLYGDDDMARFLENFSTFITSTVKDYRQSVSEIEMSGPKELEVLRSSFWNTGFTENYWNDASVLQKIFSHAQAFPDMTAISTSDGYEISYRGLINKAQKIGYALQEAGVLPGQHIGLLSRPGIEAITAMIGILLSRCGFVPLDPDFAIDRLAFMTSDSNTAIILAGKGLEDISAKVAYKASTVPRVLEISTLSFEERMIALETVSPSDPFYTIYTSGSTGKPQGVVLTQSNTQQMLSTLQKDHGFGPEDRFLFSNSISFDLSIVQIFSALTAGGTVCAASAEIRKDPVQLAHFMQEMGVTFTYFTPTQFALLLNRATDTLRKCDKYRTAFFAGERLPVRMAKAFYDLGTPATMYNTWSPCELVVQTCIHKVEYPGAENLNIPIGFPLDNCRHYIVDSRRQPLPAGLVGEICVGGAQVGAGYLNRRQANAKSFVEDPYCSPEDRARNWTRMFRTGDKGRFRADGQLEFHGRIAGDKQIKLRGFRIDLGEVEHEIHLQTTLEDGPQLADLSVVARTDQGETSDLMDTRQLIAFLVPARPLDLVQKRTLITELHKKLALKLNAYMLPNGYQFLNNLPVTIGGKVDRQNLLNRELDLLYPSMGPSDSAIARDVDANTLKAVTQIFKEVLRLPESHEVQPSDNFFELGGQSILVLRLQAKLKRTFKTSVPLSELFKLPTPIGVFRALTNKLYEVGLENSRVEDSKFKWAEETRLPNENRYMVKFGTWRQSSADISEILLVGADSFAGLHMLSTFLLASNSTIIHVVGTNNPVTPAELLQSLQRLRLMSPSLTEQTLSARVRYVPGSLAVPHFGLQHSVFRKLGETIQAIYHAGAQVSLLKSYNELKRINVEAVRDVIELAGYGSRLTQINYLSSFSVPHLQTWNTSKRTNTQIIANEETASHFSPEETPDQGYFKSRWAAEILLNQAADRGFAVAIYRSSPITASTSTKVSEPADDFVRRMALTMIESAAVPEFGPAQKGFAIDFVPVNYLASAMHQLSTHAPATKEGPAIYHITNPNPILLKNLPAVIADVRDDGKKGQMVHWDTWLNMIPSQEEKDQPMWDVIRQYFVKGHNMFALDSRKTQEALAAVGGADVFCPPVDAAYFSGMMDHADE